MASAAPVPLYDGIGFPDEPYRFVPPRGNGPAATSARVELKVAGGSNIGGLIVNTKEAGPQASVFAPPHAFLAPGTAPVVLEVKPVDPTPPLPGKPVSNVYAITLTSTAGPVTIAPEAQPPAITMRSITPGPPAPVFEYRVAPGQAWRELKTRQVGTDIFNALGPGAGEYLLAQVGTASDAKTGSGGHSGLFVVLGATVLLMVAVIVGVRVLSRRAATQPPP
jgi:hypothetical protein